MSVVSEEEVRQEAEQRRTEAIIRRQMPDSPQRGRGGLQQWHSDLKRWHDDLQRWHDDLQRWHSDLKKWQFGDRAS